MTMKRETKKQIDLGRRKTLGVGAALVSAQIVSVIGCSDDAVDGGAGGNATTGSGGATKSSGATQSGNTQSATSTASTTASASSTGNMLDWASGGTASMTDKATYPDPFTDPLGSACPIFESATLGPCYAQTLDREDISEGYTGLPVRLALLVVDGDCNPIPDAIVDIWHTSNSGLYSGDDASTFCTKSDPDATSHRYFRGYQTTDAEGKVFFDTVFPGWYTGRAIHIHFQVRVGNVTYLTSQLFFPAAIITELFSSHPDYQAFGQPDTSNAQDGIHFADGELEFSKMTDGAMLAWKVISAQS